MCGNSVAAYFMIQASILKLFGEKLMHYHLAHTPETISVTLLEAYKPILSQLKVVPESVTAWKILALMARHRGDMSTLKSARDAILSLSPNADVASLLGVSEQAVLPPEEDEFSKAIRFDPANKNLWVSYAYYCIKRGNIVNARVAYESIKALSPDDSILERLFTQHGKQ